LVAGSRVRFLRVRERLLRLLGLRGAILGRGLLRLFVCVCVCVCVVGWVLVSELVERVL
jgi:hypothetical protein